jgi:putative NIF3 family GTP cyclohydrolase 1 type 2
VAISTRELVDIALDLAEMDELPADSTIYINGSNLQKVMFGIDIGPAELLLARELECDAVIAHHPAGGESTLRFPEVLHKQIEFMVAHGVDEAAARAAAQPLITRASLGAHAANHDRTPSFARYIRMPFLNLHLPPDEVGRRIMVETVEDHVVNLDRAPVVQDAIDALMTLSEFRRAPTRIMVPVGAVDRPLGRLAVVHGAGTNGGARIATAYFDAGVGTVLYIHCAGPDVAQLQEQSGGNLIVSGHIASDLIGINRYVETIEERGVEVVRISGL